MYNSTSGKSNTSYGGNANREGQHQAANSDKVMPISNTTQNRGNGEHVQADDIALENATAVPPTLLNDPEHSNPHDQQQPSTSTLDSRDDLANGLPSAEEVKKTSSTRSAVVRSPSSPKSPASPKSNATLGDGTKKRATYATGNIVQAMFSRQNTVTVDRKGTQI